MLVLFNCSFLALLCSPYLQSLNYTQKGCSGLLYYLIYIYGIQSPVH